MVVRSLNHRARVQEKAFLASAQARLSCGCRLWAGFMAGALAKWADTQDRQRPTMRLTADFWAHDTSCYLREEETALTAA